jgi:hypothetical protein
VRLTLKKKKGKEKGLVPFSVLEEKRKKEKKEEERKSEERRKVFYKGFSNIRRYKLPISKLTSEM